jgi:hypothetical protein
MRGEAFDNAGNKCHERMRLSPLHCERRPEKCLAVFSYSSTGVRRRIQSPTATPAREVTKPRPVGIRPR